MTAEKVTVLGAGSWGTALAVHLGRGTEDGGVDEVRLWGRDKTRLEELASNRENRKYLPDVTLPGAVRPTADLAEALAGAEAVVFAVPASAMRATAKAAAEWIGKKTLVVSAAKGLEAKTKKRMSEVLGEVLPGRPLAVLSGPSHAEEVGRGLPTAVVAAGEPLPAGKAQELFHGGALRVYRNEDIVGVELAGALKNPIAIAAGLAVALGAGDNALGALITRGLAEITRLGIALGAEPMTFSGLAGLGDLVATATSRHSRNRRLGEAVGRGVDLSTAASELGMVAEGMHTVRTAIALAEDAGVDLPIHRGVARVLYEGASSEEVLAELLSRAAKDENWGMV